MAKTGNTETHLAVDEKIKQGYTQRSMNEGFASASGVRPETAESGGRLTHPESRDKSLNTDRIIPDFEEEENSGLADN